MERTASLKALCMDTAGIPHRQRPSALYGPDSQSPGSRRTTARGTGTGLEPSDLP
jgi:hypothetical protein